MGESEVGLMQLGHVQRDYHMTLKEQLESIAEDYVGFQYIMTYGRVITFMYESEVMEK